MAGAGAAGAGSGSAEVEPKPLVLRGDTVAEQHFRAPTWVLVLAVISCLLLLSQQGLDTWLRGAALLMVGMLLYGCNRLVAPVAKAS